VIRAPPVDISEYPRAAERAAERCLLTGPGASWLIQARRLALSKGL
jgi:hypothetical protein